MIHAYVRCSTLDQNPQLQIDAAIKAGADRIWLERRSAVASRPELERLFYSIRKGDLVIVWKLDRLARSLSDLLRVLDRINQHGALFQSLTEPVETRIRLLMRSNVSCTVRHGLRHQRRASLDGQKSRTSSWDQGIPCTGRLVRLTRIGGPSYLPSLSR